MEQDGTDGPNRTPAEWRLCRRYVVEFAAGLTAFVILAAIADRAAPSLAGPTRIALVLAPGAAALAMAFAVARFVRLMDELQRGTALSAGALAALATAVVTMALGLLQDAHIINVSMTVVLPMLALFWGIALPLVRRAHQ